MGKSQEVSLPRGLRSDAVRDLRQTHYFFVYLVFYGCLLHPGQDPRKVLMVRDLSLQSGVWLKLESVIIIGGHFQILTRHHACEGKSDTCKGINQAPRNALWRKFCLPSKLGTRYAIALGFQKLWRDFLWGMNLSHLLDPRNSYCWFSTQRWSPFQFSNSLDQIYYRVWLIFDMFVAQKQGVP